MTVEEAPPPPLPPGREVELPGRGTIFIRDLPGPPGAPSLLLLHGWTNTSDVTWFRTYFPMAEHYRVVAFDQRGHGRGLRSPAPFRLEDCADDAAALAEELGIDHVVPVGYSMGGPIAMHLWRRHPALVDGLVLCATAASFNSSRQDRLRFLALAGVARASRLTPAQAKARLGGEFVARRSRRYQAWAVNQVLDNDWTTVLEAGAAIGRFSAHDWVATIDRPAAVIIMTQDHVVSPGRQQRLLESMPLAIGIHIDAAHDACVAAAEQFVPALLTACHNVTDGGREAAVS